MGSAEYMNMRWDDLQKHNQVATFFEHMTYDPLEGITQTIPPGGAGIGMKVIPSTQIIDGRDARIFTSLDKDDLVLGDYDHSPRQEEGYAKENGLDMSFEDVRNVLSEEQVKVETARCLRGGAAIVDENKCIDCGVCTHKCEFDAIHLNRTHPENGKMVACEDMVKEFLPYVVKRAIKIKKQDRELKKRRKKEKENIHA